ncbi:mycofactocin precursor MftA [Arthrobacter sp. zg-Y820]|nr:MULTISPECIES: mycofactocin precursor MftA [unclassified Arthrobacter]MCC9196862.1 mycofactocin precursor MftA [Arthrobacter sp. zg-Y820]MDK1279726.1 mycofactocin precursor MftA [Arthrobacter sp. zg.Y820]WIB11016.1 mycofactocin precursor MftA [Arthrobacter sp. zg-Y820]
MISNTAATEKSASDSAAQDPEFSEDLLVEEVSIDGMCGVY